MTLVVLALATLCGSLSANEPPAGLSPTDWSQIRRSIQESRRRAAPFPDGASNVFVQAAELEGHGDPGVGTEYAWAGYSVAITGDTAFVAAPFASADGHSGAVSVFTRSGSVWNEQQKLVSSGGTNESPRSVAASGDTVVVGLSPGLARVFVRSGTVWIERQTLVASDGQPYDSFGDSVSVSGDTAIIGAPEQNGFAGAAYLFVRAGSVWTEQQKLVAPDSDAYIRFGHAVSISSDTAVVATPYTDPGRAYVFTRSGETWSEQQKLVASDGWADGNFGCSASIDGDTAVIGARGNTSVPGAAHVFVRSGTVWTEQQKLMASDSSPNARFGTAIALSGDTIAVGAPFDDTFAGQRAGSSYLFVRSGQLWTEEQKILASDGAQHDEFGSSIAVTGNTAIVGAVHHETVGGVEAGSTYAFVRPGTVWSEQQELVASDTPAGDGLGWSIAVSGDTAVVGAPFDDTLGGRTAGSAYVFVRTGAVWSEQQKLFASVGPVPSYGAGDFGWSVAVSGDTAVVGAPHDETYVGSADVFVRSGTVWTEQQKLLVLDGEGYATFGSSVSVSGDTVLVGSPLTSVGGVAYVFVRSGAAWSQQQKLVAPDGDLGGTLSVSGDSAVVSGYSGDTAVAYVFVRSGTVWNEQQKLVPSGAHTGDGFGVSTSLSGDTVIIGAHRYFATGAAYVFVRSGTAWSEQQMLLPSDPELNEDFGSSVSLSGETAVIGAAGDNTPSGTHTGSAYVFARTGTIWTEQQKLVAADAVANDGFGRTMAISGNAVVAGVSAHDTAGLYAGATYAFTSLAATDASVAKTDGQASAVPGTPVTYTLTVGDAGPGPGIGVRVVDTPPAELTGVSWTCTASSGSSCPASGTGSIDHTANVDVGGMLTYTVTGTISPSATGTLANTVTVAPPAGVSDPDPADNSATDTDTLTPVADLALSLTDSPDPIAPGNTLTYTLQATNLGPSDSSGVMVTDLLPGTLTLISSSPGCSPAGGSVTCTLGGTTPNASQMVTLQAIVNPGTVGSFSNSASLAGNETDPAGSNDTAVALTQVGLLELTHGSALSGDLRAAGGILADQDLYRIGQKPYSSYEVVVDATSADIGSGHGPDLDRLGSDASTVLQSSQAAGVASSRRLSWENESAASVLDQYLRVRSAGCSVTCAPEDVYRIRAWDTTLLGPRFNNSATQVTVLVLQNTTGTPVSGHVHFWNASGALLASEPVSLVPKASLALNTSTVVAGQSGSLTLSHDGGYGGLVGKAVSIESATGFGFDTPLVTRGH